MSKRERKTRKAYGEAMAQSWKSYEEVEAPARKEAKDQG
jgi:hypothetical protein